MGEFFFRFFEPRSLDDFHKHKISMGLYNGKNLWFNVKVVMTYIRPMGHSCSKEHIDEIGTKTSFLRILQAFYDGRLQIYVNYTSRDLCLLAT